MTALTELISSGPPCYPVSSCSREVMICEKNLFFCFYVFELKALFLEMFFSIFDFSLVAFFDTKKIWATPSSIVTANKLPV